MTKCPILPNWNINRYGECKRAYLCDPERLAVCKAKPIGFHRKIEACRHERVRRESTGETVIIRGVRHSVYVIQCLNCGLKKRVIE